jgi:Family of unknown function (DUF6221)
VTGLARFLLARIAEDKEAARLAVEGRWVRWRDQEHIPGWDGFVVIGDDAAEGAECNPVARVYTQDDAEHIMRWNPERVLAECDAKRRIVEGCTELRRALDRDGVPTSFDDEDILGLLALPYADHPDYLPEWEP